MGWTLELGIAGYHIREMQRSSHELSSPGADSVYVKIYMQNILSLTHRMTISLW